MRRQLLLEREMKVVGRRMGAWEGRGTTEGGLRDVKRATEMAGDGDGPPPPASPFVHCLHVVAWSYGARQHKDKLSQG